VPLCATSEARPFPEEHIWIAHYTLSHRGCHAYFMKSADGDQANMLVQIAPDSASFLTPKCRACFSTRLPVVADVDHWTAVFIISQWTKASRAVQCNDARTHDPKSAPTSSPSSLRLQACRSVSVVHNKYSTSTYVHIDRDHDRSNTNMRSLPCYGKSR
jgi:hypothetical protein